MQFAGLFLTSLPLMLLTNSSGFKNNIDDKVNPDMLIRIS